MGAKNMGATSISPAGDLDCARLSREPNMLQRILVVDDEPARRQLATEILSHSGFEVDAVPDGAAAWSALSDDICYDLLISDNHLPTLTGLELLKRLRAARMIVPVILVAAHLPAPEFSRSPWLRPAAVLPAPFTVGQFLGTVQEVLRAADSSRAPVALMPAGNFNGAEIAHKGNTP